MPLGREIGLGPGHIVLDGDPGPTKRDTAPNFRPMSVVAERSPISPATAKHVLLAPWQPSLRTEFFHVIGNIQLYEHFATFVYRRF